MEKLVGFVSSNGIVMVKAELYNWQVSPKYHGRAEPFAYVIHMGGMAQMFQALYDPDDEILSLYDTAYSSDEVFKFYCMDIWTAEIVVRAFIKANGFDMSETIYHISDKNKE